MNSTLVAISTLVKSNIGERCLINILMNISTPALRDYLKLANIYRGKSSKKENKPSKNDYIWMYYQYTR